MNDAVASIGPWDQWVGFDDDGSKVESGPGSSTQLTTAKVEDEHDITSAELDGEACV